MTQVMNPGDVRIFSGQSHPALAAEIANYLSVPLEKTKFSKYSNDNMYIQLGASVRGRAVFIIQSLIKPVSDQILELLMMLDIAHGAGASEIHAIIPYFSYARSDKKDAPRVSITARLIADLLQTAGSTHMMSMTLHSPQVHGFFSIPTDPLTARPLFVRYFTDRHLNPVETIVVSPDMGQANAAARFASRLGLPVAAAEKRRLSDSRVIIGNSIIRQIEGYRTALVYDDEIATGTSVIQLTKHLLEGGINKILLICTHGVFSYDALERLSAIDEIDEIITTNTVPIPEENITDKLKVLSIAPIFAEAILRNYLKQSIGDLFTYSDDLD